MRYATVSKAFVLGILVFAMLGGDTGCGPTGGGNAASRGRPARP